MTVKAREEAAASILGSLFQVSVFEAPKFELTETQSLIYVSSLLEITSYNRIIQNCRSRVLQTEPDTPGSSSA
jgi:hypothetical protein